MSNAAALKRVTILERRAIHREPFAYCAHPHMAVGADGAWLLVFNRAPRREIVLHPPQDPEYRNVLMRSEDEGRSWGPPAVVPGYGWSGVECAGLTALRSGRILLNQWRFEWLPLPVAEASGRQDLRGPRRLFAKLAASPELDEFSRDAASNASRDFPWARGGGTTHVHRSDDGGRSFLVSRNVRTDPFSGGYGLRGGVELPDGDILLPLSDVPNYRSVFSVRSRDGGDNWSDPCLIAAGDGHEFEEPAALTGGDRIVLMMRDNGTRIMHVVSSADGGRSWSEPRPTGIADYPAHLLATPDGAILCVAGRRRPPYGIVVHFSTDGESWSREPLFLVDDAKCKDLGYPTAAFRGNGDLAVVYYARDEAGVTGIHMVTARLQ